MNRELQDDERKAFEGYLLANGDPALIQKALTHLVPGSVPHNYLYFVNLLSKAKKALSGADSELFDKFVTSTKSKNTFEARQVKLWNLLRRFDSEVEARGSIIDELCKVLHFSFNDQKPQLREGIRNDESSEGEDDNRHTLVPILITNQTIIEKKHAKLEQRIKDLDKLAYQPQTKQMQALTKTFLEKLAHRGDGIWHELDFDKYDATAVYQAALSKWDQLRTFQNKSLFKQIVKGLAQVRAEDEYFTLQPHFVQAFTIQQLDLLKQLDPWFEGEDNFIGAYFQKQFSEELSAENQEAWTLQEKFQNLERLYNLAKSQNLPKTFQQEFLTDILQLGPKIGVFSKQHFRDYIDIMPKHEMHIFLGYEKAVTERQQQQQTRQKAVTNWGQYVSNLKQPDRSSSQDLFTEYLNEFCEQAKGSLVEYVKDFRADFLNQIERKWQVYLSRDGMNSLDQDKISLDFYKQVADEVQLQFNKQNKELFKVNEEVSLEVVVKNIKVLFVKVFEFNTETYYKKELQPFNTGVNLDGLDAKISHQYVYELAGNIRHRETFAFPQLNNRVGLFIVEFMGNGVSVRAVIKKGSLSLVHRSTIAGHMAYVLDENKKVCIGQKTGVWFDQKYYAADRDTGRIFIPYSKQQTQQKIIMINGDFAQLSEFCRKTEQYDFNAQYYLHSGSVLVGSSTSVIVKAQLNINGRRAQLSLLKNVKLVLMTYNYIDDLPVTKTFSNLQFSNDKELQVTFQVPPNLSHIQLNLTCELLNATTKQTEKFASSHNFGIISNNNVSDNAMFMPYLKKVNSQYEVAFLGRNGEPAAKKKVTIQLKHRLRPDKPFTQHLITNKEGVCKLGSLAQIQQIFVFADAFQHESKGVWQLQYGSGASFWSYPQQTFEVLEGDSVELPIIMQDGQTALDRKYISLTRSNENMLIDDWFDKVQLLHQGDKQFGYHYIKIEDLVQGQYQLRYVSGLENKLFHIKVTKGESWGLEGGFTLKKNCLQENVQSQNICKITSVSITPAKESKVQVQVENCQGSVRLHAFAHQYLPQQQTEFAHQLQTMLTQQISTSSFPFAKWTNIYQSNRQMADEIRYVFDRKQLESQLGNTLDRPTLLNKRNFIQNTTTETEILKQGEAFAQMACEQQMIQPGSYDDFMQHDMGMQFQNCAPQAYDLQVQSIQPMMRQQMIQPMARNNMVGRSYTSSTISTPMIPTGHSQNVHSEFHSFMKTPPLQRLNITPIKSEDGQATFEFTCDLSEFSQLVVIAVDKDSLTQKSIDIDALVTSKRDLRLLQTPAMDQGLTESRSTIEILAQGSNFIEDISSTDVTLVDDLTKVYEILSEIRKVQSVGSSGFQNFDFVLRWHTFSETEKNRYYSDYCCNELNLFIFKKDEQYFKHTVKPFLQTKMEKQFFDYYLLGQSKECVKFAELHLLQKLNTLELCFLIQVLAKEGQGAKAVAMAKNMQLEHDANSKSDQDSVNYKDKIFDLVLNLNSLNQNKDAFGSLKKATADEKLVCSSINNAKDISLFEDEEEEEIVATRSLFQPKSQMRSRQAPKMQKKKGQVFAKSIVESEDSDDDAIEKQRHQVVKKQNFEELEATSEYKETHYYQLTNNESSKSIVRLSQFWCDYAAALAQGKQYFLSNNFTDSSQSDRESFLTICVTDLPIENTQSHEFIPNEKRGVMIKAASNLLLFKKEIKACDVDVSRNDIMVIHRYNEMTGQGDSSGKPDEFLARTAYACEVVITNVAPKVKSFNLLYQVPEGSIPLKHTKYMKSQYVSLQPYRSHKVVFHFYFPNAGTFKHFPSNISVNGVVTARGGANDIKVVDTKRISKIESFDDILHAGSKQDVLNFLKTENLYNTKMQFDFNKMLYLLKDKEFFTQAIEILRDKCHFDASVWRYSLYHKDADLMCEYFMMDENAGLVPLLGAHFSCGLITVDETTAGNQGLTKHLEYHPMVNSRTHLLGQSHKIMNATFRRTYDQFLATQIQKEQLSTEDLLVFVYYLQLQDRMQEAISLFNTIAPPNELNGTLRIQYDYLQAYFDFFSGTDDGFKTARRIVQKYDNYPITSWRMMFLTIADQLNEFDGEFDNEEEMQAVDAGISAVDAQIREKRAQNKKDAKKREPQMQVEVDSAGTLKIESCNVASVCVKYYIINAELLFSRQPFLKDNTEGFSYVKAYHTLEHQIHSAQVAEEVLNQYVKTDIVIPTKLVNQNMVIEITSGDLQKFLTYYSNELKVNILEQYGELKVTHAQTGKALPMTYVKVFYQKKSNGEATFYRDGYTDIRGKIEYAQTSGDKLKDVKKFAIFVQHDKFGSRIMECDPPKEATGNGQVVTMQAQKMQRLQDRQVYANSKISKAKFK